MTLEERLLAMERRMAALEEENSLLRAQVAPPAPRVPEGELSPERLMEIRALARDVKRFGWDAGMERHGYGRKGRRAA